MTIEPGIKRPPPLARPLTEEGELAGARGVVAALGEAGLSMGAVLARFWGISEAKIVAAGCAAPQAGQNRLLSGSLAVHLGQICMPINLTGIVLFGFHLSYNRDMKYYLMAILLIWTPVATVEAFPYLAVDTHTAGFVGMSATGPLDQPVTVSSYPEFTAIFGASTAGLANPYLAPSVAGFFANGGVELVVVRVASIDYATVVGVDGGSPGSRTGLQALLDEFQVSIIAIPGVATPAVQAAMIAHCQNTELERIAILDPASPNDLNAVQAQRAGLVTDNGFAALYFPWIQAEPTGTSLLLPPSGFVAGYYSASDPPDSPVGVIATATGVAYAVTNEEQDLLNPQGINAIRDLSGIRIWGARTLATNSEWRYVSTRRLGMFLEKSVYWSTEWCLFEPNSYQLWDTLELDLENFLFDVFSDGWFQGQTPEDAYFGDCRFGVTMTQSDLDEGKTILRVGFAPQTPAEFIVFEVVKQRPDLSGVPVAPSGVVLHPAAPNPFNPATYLRFELAAEAAVDLRIYDAAGRLVRTLVAGRSFTAGNTACAGTAWMTGGWPLARGCIWSGSMREMWSGPSV